MVWIRLKYQGRYYRDDMYDDIQIDKNLNVDKLECSNSKDDLLSIIKIPRKSPHYDWNNIYEYEFYGDEQDVKDKIKGKIYKAYNTDIKKLKRRVTAYRMLQDVLIGFQRDPVYHSELLRNMTLAEHRKKVLKVIRKMININGPLYCQELPLTLAMYTGDIKLVRLLVKYGAILEWSIVMDLIDVGDTDIIRTFKHTIPSPGLSTRLNYFLQPVNEIL